MSPLYYIRWRQNSGNKLFPRIHDGYRHDAAKCAPEIAAGIATCLKRRNKLGLVMELGHETLSLFLRPTNTCKVKKRL